MKKYISEPRTGCQRSYAGHNEYFHNAEEVQNKATEWIGYIFLFPYILLKMKLFIKQLLVDVRALVAAQKALEAEK